MVTVFMVTVGTTLYLHIGVGSLFVIGTEVHRRCLDSMYRLEQGTGMRPNRHKVSCTILRNQSNTLIHGHTKV